MAKDRLYYIWQGMKSRCYNPNNKSAKWYFQKGIKVCPEWINNFAAFKEWSIKSGYDYSKSRKEQTIDRIDSNKDYSPQNCRWISMKENAKNTSRNIYLTYKGQTKCITDWSRELGLNLSTIQRRLKRTSDSELVLSKHKVVEWNKNELSGIHRKGKSDKLEVVVRRHYVGTFDSLEEAIAKKNEYIATLENTNRIYTRKGD